MQCSVSRGNSQMREIKHNALYSRGTKGEHDCQCGQVMKSLEFRLDYEWNHTAKGGKVSGIPGENHP